MSLSLCQDRIPRVSEGRVETGKLDAVYHLRATSESGKARTLASKVLGLNPAAHQVTISYLQSRSVERAVVLCFGYSVQPLSQI